jgi:hypothetical protein
MRGRKNDGFRGNRRRPVQRRHGRARMGAFLSMGCCAFFRSSRRGVATGWRAAPVLRFLGRREMSVGEASSRPKPPEAGAEGQPLRGFAQRRPSPLEIEEPWRRPSAARFFAAFGGRSNHVAHSRPRRPALSFTIGRGLDFPPFLIRSEASLYAAEAEGLHARIRGSSWNSRPICLIREARRRGTEGTGPILAAASFSHGPARRPAHLGGFSGSVRVPFLA